MLTGYHMQSLLSPPSRGGLLVVYSNLNFLRASALGVEEYGPRDER